MSFQKDTSASDGGRQVRHQVHGLGDIRKCGSWNRGTDGQTAGWRSSRRETPWPPLQGHCCDRYLI